MNATRKILFFVLLMSFVVLLGTVVEQTASASPAYQGVSLPQFKLPWPSDINVNITSGPHSFGQGFQFSAKYPAGSGSGLDFGNGTNFQVLSMAAGVVESISFSATNPTGAFGNQVVIRHTGGSVLIYGHLSEIAAGLQTGDPVLQGEPIGRVGRSTPGHFETSGMGAHLHVELRDGQTCTFPQVNGVNYCMTPDYGNPIEWGLGIVADGYQFFGYYETDIDGVPTWGYNYDGSMVRGDWQIINGFPYTDTGGRRLGQARVGINFSCNLSSSTCENASDPNTKFASVTYETAYSLYPAVGGGTPLVSTNSAPSQPPTPTPGPTDTPVPQYGDSRVDIREDTNYQSGQYGWDNPTGGWFNVPDYMDNKTSSIQIDQGWSIKVAKDQNGGGATKCLVTSYPDLSGAYYDDGSPMTDTISSVWVYADSTCGGSYIGTEPGDTVTVWVNPNYDGTHYGWHDPASGNIPDYVRNGISAIGIASGWSAVLYENQNLGGGFACFTASNSNLTSNLTNTGTPVNDNIESIEVFHDSNCGGRMHAPTAILTSTVTNIATKEVTNHLVWSGASPGWQHFDFGDGATFDVQGGSGNVSPTHQYANYGTYTVTVTVYGTDGVGYPYSQQVVVQPQPPTYSLMINSANTATGLVDFTLNWNNALADWHHIDFGDGQSFDVNGASGTQNATHVYNPGTYTLSFTVKGLDGQNYPTSQQIVMPEPTLSLTVNSVDAVSGLVNYTATWANAPVDSWQRVDFGHDGSYVDYQGSADTKVDSHIFPVGTFTMTFTVNSRTGQTYQTTQQIVVTGPPPPTYSLTIDSVDQQTGLVTFTLSWNNALPDWHHIDFGNGQSFDVNGTSGSQQATHTYDPGTYTMTFTVKGQNGQNYPTSQQITVGS